MAKTTKKEMFNLIIEACNDNDEIVNFCYHEIELLEKKNARPKSMTKTQRENENLKTALLDILPTTPTTIKEIQSDENFKEFSNQKLASLLNHLVSEGRATKTVDKKTVMFARKGE